MPLNWEKSNQCSGGLGTAFLRSRVVISLQKGVPPSRRYLANRPFWHGEHPSVSPIVQHSQETECIQNSVINGAGSIFANVGRKQESCKTAQFAIDLTFLKLIGIRIKSEEFNISVQDERQMKFKFKRENNIWEHY